MGELIGIDLASGEIAWRRPFGTGKDSGPLGIRPRLPITIGVPNTGGSVITAGRIAFIAATNDYFLRAIDVDIRLSAFCRNESIIDIDVPDSRPRFFSGVSGTDGGFAACDRVDRCTLVGPERGQRWRVGKHEAG